MIYLTIDVLRQKGMRFVIAPYEADAQIYYLIKQKHADFAITEDSDLIVYGCPLIAYKIKVDGTCDLLDNARHRTDKEERKKLADGNLRAFYSFSDVQTIETCILAGCDYLPSIKGLGIKKASDLMYRFQSAEAVIKHLQQDKVFRDRVSIFLRLKISFLH